MQIKGALQGYKRVVGINRAAMGMLQKEIENTSEGFQPLFKIDELREEKQRKQRSKLRKTTDQPKTKRKRPELIKTGVY